MTTKRYPFMTYDGTVKAIYVYLREGKVAKTIGANHRWVHIDYDKDNNALGVEIILPASYDGQQEGIKK